MATVVRLETRRILLPGYGCQMWYLGERVYHWYSGPSRRRISFPIPSSMLWSCSLIGPALRAALEGYDTTTLLERSRHYQQYIRENILEQVPIGDAEVCFLTSLVLPMLLCPILTIVHQFEEVGSPAAGEAMEEHVDTERTETDRASHSQHTEMV